MNWASSLFGVLLLTDITGTIFFFAGSLIGKPAKNDIKFLRFITEVTLCAYLVPFVYIILYLVRRISISSFRNDIHLFYTTPSIWEMNAILGCIWMGLFLVLLAYRLYRRYLWTKICRGNIPEEDERIFKLFTDICAGLGIDGEVSLCRNDLVNVPCITRHHGFVVILPLKNYTEREAEVIFYHELCHYLNRDLYLKTIGIIVVLLHVFNPTAHILFNRMDLLCERYCDRTASKKGKDRFTVKQYFQIILSSLVSDRKNDKFQLFALADDISNYERRLAYMVNYHKHGGLRRGTALVLAVGFLLGSSVTALAAGDGVADAYKGLVEETSVKSSDTADKDDEVLTELMRAYDLDPERVHMMDDDVDPYATIRQVWWTVPPGDTCMASGMVQYDGDMVCIEVIGTPHDPDYEGEDIVYQMGLQDPKLIMRYVEGSGVLHHDFYIDITGRYYFFVTNLSETEKLDIEATLVRHSGPIATVE